MSPWKTADGVLVSLQAPIKKALKIKGLVSPFFRNLRSAVARESVTAIRAAIGVSRVLTAVTAVEAPIGAVNLLVVPFLALAAAPTHFTHRSN